MDTLQEISTTLERLKENEEALSSIEHDMFFEKEALDRTQESLLSRLEFLKGEYLKAQSFYLKLKFIPEKQIIYEQILAFNRIAKRPLTGYLPLFRESNTHLRRRRMGRLLAVK